MGEGMGVGGEGIWVRGWEWEVRDMGEGWEWEVRGYG